MKIMCSSTHIRLTFSRINDYYVRGPREAEVNKTKKEIQNVAAAAVAAFVIKIFRSSHNGNED